MPHVQCLPACLLHSRSCNEAVLLHECQLSHVRPWLAMRKLLSCYSQDASFDVVTCQYGLFFMPEHVKALQEAARVLRPGGLLTASVFTKEQQMVQVRKPPAVCVSGFDNPVFVGLERMHPVMLSCPEVSHTRSVHNMHQ